MAGGAGRALTGCFSWFLAGVCLVRPFVPGGSVKLVVDSRNWSHRWTVCVGEDLDLSREAVRTGERRPSLIF